MLAPRFLLGRRLMAGSLLNSGVRRPSLAGCCASGGKSNFIPVGAYGVPDRSLRLQSTGAVCRRSLFRIDSGGGAEPLARAERHIKVEHAQRTADAVRGDAEFTLRFCPGNSLL